MKRYVMGDIHGSYLSLLECLKLSNFDYDNDQLIFLGDVCDSWSGVISSIEELLKIKNLIHLMGNHDWWTLEYINGRTDTTWLEHGGLSTKRDLDSNPNKIPMVKRFIEDSLPYYIDNNNNLFVHAGIDLNRPIEMQYIDTFIWTRKMVVDTIENNKSGFYKPDNKYNQIFIGHTTTIKLFGTVPVKIGKNINMIDTGAGFKGKLTIMNIDTGEYFQSTPHLLYPNESGR